MTVKTVSKSKHFSTESELNRLVDVIIVIVGLFCHQNFFFGESFTLFLEDEVIVF